MTPVSALEKSIEREKSQARDYIVRILSILDSVPDEAAKEIAPHLAAALDEARRAVREEKKRRGVDPGTDTAIVDQETMDRFRKEWSDRNGKPGMNP